MGAGLASSSINNVNTNLNTFGGSKKQGITSRVGLDHWANQAVQTYSNGYGRNRLFYMNQLGGVGVGKSMFNGQFTQVDGVGHNIYELIARLRGLLRSYYNSSDQYQLALVGDRESFKQDLIRANQTRLANEAHDRMIHFDSDYVFPFIPNRDTIISMVTYLNDFFRKIIPYTTRYGTHTLTLVPKKTGEQLQRAGYGVPVYGLTAYMSTAPIAPTPASMSLTYGGVMWNGYAACGGSRLYLSTVNTTASNTSRQVDYINIDCTQPKTIISLDVNISTLKAGCIFTFYLVPMLTAQNDRGGTRYRASPGTPSTPINPVLATGLENIGGLLDAENGLGYTDAQSNPNDPNGAAKPSIEIDLFEMTLCNVQTTTHGYMADGTTIDTNGSYQNAWGSTGTYTSSSEYTQDIKFDKNKTPPPFGPGPAFTINTLSTFHVSSSITFDSNNALTLTTTITQGSNSITLIPPVQSYNFNTSIAIDGLKTMQLVSALWVSAPLGVPPQDPTKQYPQTWLDGIDNGSNKSYAQGQPVVSSTSNELPDSLFPPSILDPPSGNGSAIDYTSYAMPMDSPNKRDSSNNLITATLNKYGSIFARCQNIVIEGIQTNNRTNASVSGTTCWTLDYLFRGLNSDLTNWHGFYGNSYGVAYAPVNTGIDISEYSIPNSTQRLDNPSAYLNAVTNKLNYQNGPVQTFAELTGLGQTDDLQKATLNAAYKYGYSLDYDNNPADGDKYQTNQGGYATSSNIVQQLQYMNKWGCNFLSTPDLISFQKM
jgi:hypothetical protein